MKIFSQQSRKQKCMPMFNFIVLFIISVQMNSNVGCYWTYMVKKDEKMRRSFESYSAPEDHEY